jgi:hypothetical protein
MVWGAKQIKEICKRNRSLKLGRRGCVEGFQTSICLEGDVRNLYQAREVWAFCAAVSVWCREPKQGDS